MSNNIFHEEMNINKEDEDYEKVESVSINKNDNSSQEKTNFSILDLSINVLESLDVDVVRKAFLTEIIELSNADKKIRNERLQYLFEKLFKIQPDNEYFTHDHLSYSEQRLYMDLISTPGLKDISYFREFLLSEFQTDNQMTLYKKRLLLRIFDYYDNHSPELINKLNYILKSSDRISSSLLKKVDEFDNYFTDEAMSFFSKEDLAQIYIFSYMFTSIDFFSSFKRKELFLISAMTKKVSSIIGHSNEFLDNILDVLNRKSVSPINFSLMLDNIYNQLVGSKENETKFLDDLINNDCYPEILELINSINNGELKCINGFITVFDYMNRIAFRRDGYNLMIFKLDAMKDLKDGNFDKDSGFKDIESALDLKEFKEAVLYNIYGIDFKDAGMFVKNYCRNIDELEKDILEEDKQIFSILKSIYNIINLDICDSNFKEKVRIVQLQYYDFLVKHGFNYRGDFFSSVILKGLFNKMFINTYNKRLLRVDSLSSLEVDQGVLLLDAGLEFNVMLNSLSGTNDIFYNYNVNMASKWNTSSFSDNQGICMSHISNQNLGVIMLNGVLLGFSYIPEYGFNDMGPYDIYSIVNRFNLRGENLDGQYFVPGSIISDSTRFGYNEFLVDRFLLGDEEKIKLQPDYVVFYKMCDYFKETDLYKKSLKIAKDFNIPIVVVDVLKVKENEQKVIRKMEEELFISDKCDKNLMNDIIVRYMNNYTGALVLTSVREYPYEEDFSVDGLCELCEHLYYKIRNIDDLEIRKSWILAFKEVYNEEKRKYNEAKSVQSYGYSVKDFILDDIEVIEQIFNLESLKEEEVSSTVIVLESGRILKKDNQLLSSYEYISLEECETAKVKVQFNSGRIGIFTMDICEELKTIINFFKELNLGEFDVKDSYTLGEIKGNLIYINPDKTEEVSLIENLIISYFFESQCMIADSLLDYDLNVNDEFNSTDDFDFISLITNSPYKDILDKDSYKYVPVDNKLFDGVINKIENLDDGDFLKIFAFVIDKKAQESGERFEVIAGRLLDKKNNMRKVFDKVLFGKGVEDSFGFKK